MKFLIAIILSFSIHAELFDHQSQTIITLDQLEQIVPRRAHIVLGEYHDDPVIQKGQQKIIEAFMNKRQTPFSLSWEFLDFPDQAKVDHNLISFKNKSVDGKEFMLNFYPNGQYVNYLQPISSLIDYDGRLVAINAPRVWKRMITKDGLANLNTQYLPPNMEMGTANYEERFYMALGGGGHAPSEALIRYYEAQCYTDSTMAWQAEQNSEALNFIMVGSFHSDYGDGMVEQLKKVTDRDVINIKIINKAIFTEDQILTMKGDHPKYGKIADYLFIVEKESE